MSAGIVLSLVGAMVATLLGAGAFVDAFHVQDGAGWLWSSKPGSASRVNANSGRVDMRQPLVDARGHRVKIIQNDKYLIMHDLDSGRVTSVDLTRMGFTGALNVGRNSDVAVVLHGDSAAVIDRGKGVVRGIDPVTLRASREVLRAPPPIVGGAFDRDGTLWLAAPSQGTVIAATVSKKSVRSQRVETVADPGHDLAMTVLDHGALVIDRSDTALTLVSEDEVTAARLDGSLAGAVAPARTVGRTVAITSPEDRSVIVLRLGKDGEDPLRPARFRLPDQVEPAAAVPYANRIYVPDEDAGVVHVFTPAGKRLDTLALPGAEGELELEVREGTLFINSPDSAAARVVDKDGSSRQVDKYREDVAGGGGLTGHVKPAPQPGDDADGDPDEQGPPGPPIPVTAVAGDEKVDLSWGSSAAGGGPIQSYSISWDGGSRKVAGRHDAQISGLENGTSYTFRVVARNRFGESPPALSDPVTPSDRIPQPPTEVRAKAAPDEGGVEVTWQPVAGARDYVVTALRGGRPAGNVPRATVSGPEAVIRGLEYGQPYRFRVVARNDSGAGSKPSAPSNQVRPYAAPEPPPNPRAQGTGDNQVTVSWGAAAANGDPVSKYVVTPSAGDPVTVGGNARKAVVDGLPTGKTVTFEIAAHNKAGAGKPATASAKVGRAPTITIGATPGDHNKITVNFRVNGHGMPVRNCGARIQGGATYRDNCSRIVVKGVFPGRSYTVIVSARNDIGSGEARKGSVSTKRLMGRVTCKNDTSSSDPDRRTYCNRGVSTYRQPDQTSASAGRLMDGARREAVCKRRDRYPASDDRAVKTAYVYNNNKSSRWWIKMPNGTWIPHIWLNLDAGDGDTANLAVLPKC